MEKSTRLRELIIDEISANDQPIHQSIIDICHSDDNQIQLIFMLDSDPSIFFYTY
jgi:phosphotransferase system IIB component